MDALEPLLDELLDCITSYTPPGGIQPLTGKQLILSQIQEPATILQLYEEVLSVHLGFSIAERLSTYRLLMAATLNGCS